MPGPVQISGGPIEINGGPYECDDCPCDEVSTSCNPVPVLTDLPLVLTYRGVQESVTLTYNPLVPGLELPGWAVDSIAVYACDAIRITGVTLWCNGGSWAAAFVTEELNGVGQWIQQSHATGGGGMTNVVVVSTDPLCLTTTYPGFSNPFHLDDCPEATLYFAIGTCDVYPPCPDWASLPATATLTYTVGSMAQETMNLTKNVDEYQGNKTCDVGDGHSVIWQIFRVECVNGRWNAGFDQFILVDGVTVTSFATWSSATFPGGSIVNQEFSIATSPFHAHFAKNSGTGSTSGGATKVCNGKTYPFGVGIAGVFDAVTP